MSAFDRILAFTLHHEGGFVNNPADPGGRTDHGISERYHPDAWADGKVTAEEAAVIYRAKYWNAAGCDRFADPIAMVLFECAVNPGLVRGCQFLQAALGVEVDGRIGPVTIVRARSSDALVIALRMVEARSGYWIAKSSEGQKIRFLDGWMNRSEALRAELLKGG